MAEHVFMNMRTLKEKDLKRIIKEAISELQAYHGSGADFSKFNHKKYIASGFGSQAFGWGTYVTNNIAIANSYADSALKRKSHGKMLDNNAQSFVYEVDIPDDNGTNYLSWYDIVKPEQMQKIHNGILNLRTKLLKLISKRCRTLGIKMGLYAQYPDEQNVLTTLMNDKRYEVFFGNKPRYKLDGSSVYHRLSIAFDSQKAASLFLMQCGFDGIVYEVGRWKKSEDTPKDTYNFVIFDANKVKILKKELYNKEFQNNK
jgi:hypothetical protein